MIHIMKELEEARRAAAKRAHESAEARRRAWRIFFEASGRLQGVLETRLKRMFGLTLPDYNILLALWEAPGRCLRMGELAERVVYSPSRLTYLVAHLERDGWVRRVTSTRDRRSSDACLTSQGVATVEAATAAHEETVREYLLDGMTDEEIGQIVRIFSAVGDRLRHEGA